MRYRPEIDGLRALAVVAVLLFHADFTTFSGGFIGVDIFFTISGYLITNLIIKEVYEGNFSFANFYERRARRIIPALYMSIFASCIFSYIWMMPDELKNFGQSLVSTTTFSNNILLLLTSDYWDIASEFKPLLHTWSLSIEEQFYFIFPLFLIFLLKYHKKYLSAIIAILLLISLLAAELLSQNNPSANFYLAPTRAWELLIGAILALHMRRLNLESLEAKGIHQALSLLGLVGVVIPMLYFGKNEISPGLHTLIPVLGASLIIIYAKKSTVIYNLLSYRPIVSIGLISYSLYLWHQPIFSFYRVYSKSPPTGPIKFFLLVLTFGIAFITWRYIETPFRNRKKISRNTIAILTIFFSLSFITYGLLLNSSYGLISRVNWMHLSIDEVDKRIYNERAFSFKKNSFSDEAKLKLLIIGNSFARDFVNMNIETFNMNMIEIVYRDDFSECIAPFQNNLSKNLFQSADVIVFASGKYLESCVNHDINFALTHKKKIFYVGTKNFGYNLNWLIRSDLKNFPIQYNPFSPEVKALDVAMSKIIPPENYLSLLSPLVDKNSIQITDSHGRILSADREHLTKYGAIFLGEKSLLNSNYDQAINRLKE